MDARVGDLVAVTELAGERLVDPAWVSEAIATAGLTRDW